MPSFLSCCDIAGRWAGLVLLAAVATSAASAEVPTATEVTEPPATRWSVQVDNERAVIAPGEHTTYTVVVRDGAGSGPLSIDGVLDAGMSVDAMGVTCTASGEARCGTAIDGGAGSRVWRFVGADLSAPSARLVVTVPVTVAESIPLNQTTMSLDHRVSVSRADLATVVRAKDRDRLVLGPPTFALRASRAALWLVGMGLVGLAGAAWWTRRQRATGVRRDSWSWEPIS